MTSISAFQKPRVSESRSSGYGIYDMLVEGKQPENTWIDVGTEMVTAENVDGWEDF